MTDVVINVEMRIVHPDGMITDRGVRQALAVAGNEVQPGGDVVANFIDVDTALGCAQRPGFGNRAGRR